MCICGYLCSRVKNIRVDSCISDAKIIIYGAARLVRDNADAVDFHDEIVADAAYLARLDVLNHPLTDFRKHLDAGAETFLHAALARDVLDVERHAADSLAVLAARGIEPSRRDSALRVSPLELLREVPDLIPTSCRFCCRHNFLILSESYGGLKRKMGLNAKRALRPSQAARLNKQNLVFTITALADGYCKK